MRVYDNWKGVTLLPVISEVFRRVMMNRMKQAVEQAPRKEQTGLRSRTRTTEQIFVLRNILKHN